MQLELRPMAAILTKIYLYSCQKILKYSKQRSETLTSCLAGFGVLCRFWFKEVVNLFVSVGAALLWSGSVLL